MVQKNAAITAQSFELFCGCLLKAGQYLAIGIQGYTYASEMRSETMEAPHW
jgi:hypothetical protein